MSADRRRALLLLGALLAASPAGAQTIRREFGIQAMMLDARTDLVGGGLLAGFRPTPRARVQAFAGLFGADGTTVGRGEVVAHFLLAPGKRRGAGVYAGGGLAVNVATTSEALMVAMVGIEGRPGGRRGWFVEGGVGGGWRLGAGWRWRGR